MDATQHGPRILRLVLGDQLNEGHSWFSEARSDVCYVLMETLEELRSAEHHIQKVLAWLAARRAFAERLRVLGHTVCYLRLDDGHNRQGLADNIRRLVLEHRFKRFEYQLPDAFGLDESLVQLSGDLGIPCASVDSEHFLTARNELGAFFTGKKQHRMEPFYRHMRKTHGILVQNGRPVGERWNFDRDNRNAFPGDRPAPEPLLFNNDVSSLRSLLAGLEVETFGSLEGDRLIWPVSRKQALELLDDFLSRLLPRFGTYQDAMHTSSWSLFHSRLSFALNMKMLHPREVIDRAIQTWENENPDAKLQQLEAFVRQILGWREFMRGIYWSFMPAYRTWNHFGHSERLPGYYWSGETRMRCMEACIGQTLRLAYAHHIQRLMVTGNFALLAGVRPDEIDAWYLGVYIDAVEWVETTNTRGMSQYADGGIIASKPYAASANYISSMSDYCASCSYETKGSEGNDTCPFNSLYWDFFDRNKPILEGHPRLGLVYSNWRKQGAARQRAVKKRADWVRSHLEEL